MPPRVLSALLDEARERARSARLAQLDSENIWWAISYESEIEWVCNVVSAALMATGRPVIINPTARGAMKAAEILGVADA